MLDFLFRPSIGFSLLFFVIYATYFRLSSKPNLPEIPWLGLRREWFAKLRCRWRTTINYRESIELAYQEVSIQLPIFTMLVLIVCEVFTQRPCLHPPYRFW
jgi:hypothetical protein